MNDSKLPLGVKLGYGACDFGGNVFFNATAFVLLNYLTDTVGLAAGLAGIALMIGRLWDAFFDPVMGFISDRTVTKMGRRRPYILFGAFPLFISMVIMFTNPSLVFGAGISQTALFAYALIVYTILCTAYSTVNIPYTALAPELTSNYNERTSLHGYRSGFAVTGTLVGAGAALPIVALCQDKNMGFILMGLIFGGTMLASALVTVFTVREPADLKPATSMSFFKTYREVFKNKPYVLILFTFIFCIVGMTIISGIAIYYFKYILDAENMTTPGILISLVTAVLFVPVSVFMSKKLGKKLAYAIGLLTLAAALMVIFCFGQTMGLNFILVMMFFIGIGFGLTYVPPYSILADAIEYDYLKVGERREGAFLGIWTWGYKISQALAVFLIGVVLQYMGYVANVMPQPESVQFSIRLFLGPIAAALYTGSAIFLYFYPITEKRYKVIREQITAMEMEKTR